MYVGALQIFMFQSHIKKYFQLPLLLTLKAHSNILKRLKFFHNTNYFQDYPRNGFKTVTKHPQTQSQNFSQEKHLIT